MGTQVLEFHNSLRSVIKTMTWSAALMVISVGAIWAVATSDWLGAGLQWTFYIVGGVVIIASLLAFISSFAPLSKEGRVAVGISDAGVSVLSVPLIPWEDIEKITFTCVRYPGGQSAAVMQALRTGVNHVVLERKSGDPEELIGEKAKFHRFGMEDELQGGSKAFIAMCKALMDAATPKGVPVFLEESGRPWMREALGMPPVSQ